MPPLATHAQAHGVVVLREPWSSDPVAELVTSVIEAWQSESLEGLTALLTPDAGPLDGRTRGRSALIESWRQRLHAHPYGRLAGLELVRPERVERWEYEDLGGPSAPARPAEMHPGEVYVRVPLEMPRFSGEKLFDDVLVMLLRREDGKYRIAAYGETAGP